MRTCEVCGWHGPVQTCEACGLRYCRGCAEEPEYGTGFNCPERDCPCHPIPETLEAWEIETAVALADSILEELGHVCS